MQGALHEWATHIELDSAGNVYTTGGFDGTVDFDPGPGTHNLINTGDYDIFISKLDRDGALIWALRLGGVGGDEGVGLGLDASGNVYTTGYFRGTVDFDPGPSIANLTSMGDSDDAFILKLDRDGSFVWVKSLGGTLDDYTSHVEVDSSGNVYTTGYFQGTADLDPGVSTYNVTSAGAYDIFISKLDSNGNFIWARTMGERVYEESYALALDASGNVYTTGYFQGTADFDPGPGIASPVSTGIHDIFISKLDSSGRFVWAPR